MSDCEFIQRLTKKMIEAGLSWEKCKPIMDEILEEITHREGENYRRGYSDAMNEYTKQYPIQY